jgi:hypothetical protein
MDNITEIRAFRIDIPETCCSPTSANSYAH